MLQLCTGVLSAESRHPLPPSFALWMVPKVHGYLGCSQHFLGLYLLWVQSHALNAGASLQGSQEQHSQVPKSAHVDMPSAWAYLSKVYSKSAYFSFGEQCYSSSHVDSFLTPLPGALLTHLWGLSGPGSSWRLGSQL